MACLKNWKVTVPRPASPDRRNRYFCSATWLRRWPPRVQFLLVLAEVVDFTHATRLLDKLLGTPETSLMEAAGITFRCDFLSDEALNDLAKALAKVSTPKTSLFSTKAIALATAYHLKSTSGQGCVQIGSGCSRFVPLRLGALRECHNRKSSTWTERLPPTATPKGPRMFSSKAFASFHVLLKV